MVDFLNLLNFQLLISYYTYGIIIKINICCILNNSYVLIVRSILYSYSTYPVFQILCIIKKIKIKNTRLYKKWKFLEKLSKEFTFKCALLLI